MQDLEALRQPACEAGVLKRVGEKLRRLMKPCGWPEMAAQIESATAQGRKVFISIRSAAAELYALPWELLTFKESGRHLAELPGVLLRYECQIRMLGPRSPRRVQRGAEWS